MRAILLLTLALSASANAQDCSAINLPALESSKKDLRINIDKIWERITDKYIRTINSGKNKSGDLEIEFRFNPDGTACSVNVISDKLENPKLISKLEPILSTVTVPATTSGYIIKHVIHFEFAE